mgnify:CR=1 FL=1
MKKADKELEIILSDKLHGSSELLNLICQHFLKYQDSTAYLQKALIRIRKNLSHFPVITNFTKYVDHIINGKMQESLSDSLRDFSKKRDEVYQAIFKKASKYLSKYETVLTISHSRTLIKILELWKKSNPNLKVIVCESRPEQEGILMAKEISKLKIETNIITEAMSGNIISEIDLIVLGADQILKNGSIINKTGSRMLAILAKYHRIPVVILASSDKIVNEKISKNKIRAKYDIAPLRVRRIKSRNEIFEEIENKLITKIFTD